MALVQRDDRQLGRRVAAQATALAGTRAVSEIMRELNRLGLLRGSDSTRGSSNTPKSRRNAGKQKGNERTTPSVISTLPSLMMYKSVRGNAGPSKLAMKDQFVWTQTNTSAGQVSNNMAMSLTNDSAHVGVTNFCSLSTKLTNFRGMYRHWGLRRMKITWVPNLSDSATGNVCVAVDSDPTNFANTSVITFYLNKDTHLFQHVIGGASTVWTPREAKEREERYTTDPTSGHDIDELSYGIVQIFIPNNQTISTSVGHLIFEVDVVFSNPSV